MPKQSAKAASRPKKPKANSKPARVAEPKKRQIAKPSYKSFRLGKRIQHQRPHIAGAYTILRNSIATVRKRKKLFFGIAIVYLLLNIVFVKGFSSTSNIVQLKDTLDQVHQAGVSGFLSNLGLYGVLVGNLNAATTERASIYQSFLLIMISLSVIWALRMTLNPAMSKKKLEIRDAFYKSQYPFVPFLLVMAVIALQLIPMALASFLYSSVIVSGLAATSIEQALWFILLLLLALLSFYMITSSIFALYIVTLPDVRPMQALRSARDLVKHRRWQIMRKLLFLPFVLIVISGIITLPTIILAPAISEWVFFLLGAPGLMILHSYLYTLYRELL